MAADMLQCWMAPNLLQCWMPAAGAQQAPAAAGAAAGRASAVAGRAGACIRKERQDAALRGLWRQPHVHRTGPAGPHARQARRRGR